MLQAASLEPKLWPLPGSSPQAGIVFWCTKPERQEESTALGMKSKSEGDAGGWLLTAALQPIQKRCDLPEVTQQGRAE